MMLKTPSSGFIYLLKRLTEFRKIFISTTLLKNMIKDGPACQGWRHKRHGLNPWVRKIPWRWAQQPPPVFLLGESPWIKEPDGLYTWGHKESDTTKVT